MTTSNNTQKIFSAQEGTQGIQSSGIDLPVGVPSGSSSRTIVPNISGVNVTGQIGSGIGAIIVKVGADNVPQQCPGLIVQPGDKVFIRPLPTNASPLQLAQYENAAKNGPCDYIATSQSEFEYPVSNLGRIWICGKKDDGVSVTIRRSANQ